MAEKLKIISLGGLNEIGKNMTVYEYGGDIIVVDCGMGFPDDDMYGIDVVIPDVSYLIKNQNKIRGIFITHGHEDHIGALPYVLRSVTAPIYATRMSAGLIKLKLEEHRLLDRTKLITCEPGSVVKAGKFSVEFIHVNHSIADAVAFAIKCPVGTCVHTRCAQQIAAFLNDRYGGRVYAIVSTSTAWPVARRLIGAIASEKMVLGARQDDPRALVAEMVGRS